MDSDRFVGHSLDWLGHLLGAQGQEHGWIHAGGAQRRLGAWRGNRDGHLGYVQHDDAGASIRFRTRHLGNDRLFDRIVRASAVCAVGEAHSAAHALRVYERRFYPASLREIRMGLFFGDFDILWIYLADQHGNGRWDFDERAGGDPLRSGDDGDSLRLRRLYAFRRIVCGHWNGLHSEPHHFWLELWLSDGAF